ncbi:hypothetical protein EH165_10625 [Nakamurella antarctica]|uniref:Membrane protein involved in the export of O-antigen and teichoic acid n=2 Tax=Nakamurella antarctica TaxID=1902245 RepID=A0A3G8ZP13_9ACTN|nr:hypothetical protein EH165_10625 [Nakamurella antarctica]
MTGGTLLIGLSGYAFLALIGHNRFDEDSHSALTVTYLIVSILGPGIFVAIEQETSRTVSASRSQGRRYGGDIRRLSAVGAVLCLITLSSLAIAAPTMMESLLNSNVGFILALALSIIGSAVVYLIRGLSGGEQRFARYALTLCVDGGVRLLSCVALVVVGSTTAVAYAFALCSGPLVAALATLRVPRPQNESQQASDTCALQSKQSSWKTLIRGVGWLLVASLISMVMANYAGVFVTSQLLGHKAIATGFSTALVLTRVPLLLMGPLQALLLPRMSAAVSRGDLLAFRSIVTRGLAVVAALGLLSLLGVAVLGRWAIRLVFGAETDTTTSSALILLTLSAVLLMAVSLLQPALIALKQHSFLVVGWFLGAVVFAGALGLPFEPITSAIGAQIAGPATTLLVHTFAILRRSNSV